MGITQHSQVTSLGDICAVYRITIGERFYIGSTINLRKRINDHFAELKIQKHANKFMQRAWDKNKEFNVEVLQLCDQEELLQMEQKYIDTVFGADDCMNMQPVARLQSGWKIHRDILAARTPRTFSAEERQARSERGKGRLCPKSTEHIERHRVSIGRLTWDDVAEIRRLWENREMSQYAIAEKFGMSQSHISKICSGVNWVRS
jgi:hypothetical protein